MLESCCMPIQRQLMELITHEQKARCNEVEEDDEALPSLSNEDMQNFLRVN